MGSIIEYVNCECGNMERHEDYYYKTGEIYEFCDCCGFYNVNRIVNRPENGVYGEDWKPIYEEKSGRTGFVLKVFEKEGKGNLVMCLEKKEVKLTIDNLIKDENVIKFGITFKDIKSGNIQTEIFNKVKN